MTEEQLHFELERRGGNFSAWPEDLRSAAEALIKGSPAAERRLREAQSLDRMLLDMPAPPVSQGAPDIDALVAGIVVLPQQATSPSVFGMPGSARLRYAACVAAVLAGFAVGVVDGRRMPIPTDLLDLALGPTGGLNVE